MQFDPVIPAIASLVLSYVFVVAAIHKWRNIEDFRTTLANYQVLPDKLLGIFIFAVPTLELLGGIALLFPYSANMATMSIAVLLLMYMSAIGINLLRGRRTIDCGCGGSEQKQAISEWLLLRNAGLLFLAYSITATVQPRTLLWFDWVVVFLATLVTCLFYNIINQLLVNNDLLKVLRSHYG